MYFLKTLNIFFFQHLDAISWKYGRRFELNRAYQDCIYRFFVFCSLVFYVSSNLMKKVMSLWLKYNCDFHAVFLFQLWIRWDDNNSLWDIQRCSWSMQLAFIPNWNATNVCNCHGECTTIDNCSGLWKYTVRTRSF